jgi:ubiquinol-cytochrome c reductase cytochrome c subunit
VIAPVVVITALLLVGWTSRPRAPVAATTASADARLLYRAQCAACNQWAGDGGALLHREAPPLGAPTPTQLAEAVRTGPVTMPVFGPAASATPRVADVAGYVEYIDAPDDRGGQPLWHLGPVAEGALGLLGLAVRMVAIRLMGSAR